MQTHPATRSRHPSRFGDLLIRILLGCLMVASASTGQTVVASYQADFDSQAPITPGWQYLWNAPVGWTAAAGLGDLRSGFLGVPAGYRALEDAGTFWTPDGDNDGSNHDPAGFLKLTGSGGHPGRAMQGENRLPRHAIAAFTVPSAGLYAIENSFITRNSEFGDGIEVLVFPGVSGAIVRKQVAPTSTEHFDVEIGYLEAGQTIYVAIGPNGSPDSDGFSMDFEVVHYPRQSLQAQLDTAVALGADTVTLTPGRYYTNDPGRDLRLRELDSFTLRAEGVELVCQTPNRAVEIRDCNELLFTDLTLSYDPPTHVQGTIESLGSDWLDLRLHPGYPLPSGMNNSGVVHEPTFEAPMKAGCFTRYPNGMTELEPDLFRYTYPSTSDQASVGDFLTLRNQTGTPHAIFLGDSNQIRLERLTLQSSPVFSVFSSDGEGLEVDQVTVAPIPQPLLADVRSLRSSSADGIHVSKNSGEVRITNCRVLYAGDDSIVITGPYAAVIGQPAGNVVTIVFKRDYVYAPGDRLRLYEQATVERVDRSLISAAPSALDAATVDALTSQHFPNATFFSSEAIELTLDAPVNATPGDVISNLDQTPTSFTIANCEVSNTRARGILIKGSNGVVSNNRIERSYLAGIQLRPEAVVWLEGDYASNVEIRDNQLFDCGMGRGARGSVRLDSETSSWDARGHEDILIAGNTITRAPGCNIYVRHANRLVMDGNTFVDSHETMVENDSWNQPVVWLDTVNDIEFAGFNSVVSPGLNIDRNALVGFGSRVTNVNGQLYLNQGVGPDLTLRTSASVGPLHVGEGDLTLDLWGMGTVVSFADSSSIDWLNGRLRLDGFVPGIIRFGTNGSGLTGAQLASIESTGYDHFALDSNGYLTAELVGARLIFEKRASSGGPWKRLKSVGIELEKERGFYRGQLRADE